MTLLSRVPCEEPLGTNWLTFVELQAVVARHGGDIAITAHDRTYENADWS